MRRASASFFPVPHWGFERVHPAGMSPDLIKRMVKEIPNIVCIKAESGMPMPAGLVPIQFMGTSNYEFFGGLIPRMFKMVKDGRFEEMMAAGSSSRRILTVNFSSAVTQSRSAVSIEDDDCRARSCTQSLSRCARGGV